MTFDRYSDRYNLSKYKLNPTIGRGSTKITQIIIYFDNYILNIFKFKNSIFI